MDQPVTRAEFNRYVEEQKQLKEEVKQLRQWKEQRQTDEMKAINVNVGSQDVIDRLDELEQQIEEGQKELKTVSETWLEVLQAHYTEYTTRFDTIESTMATKEDLKAMATKEDLKAMATKDEMATMKEDIIDAIRKYSQPGKN